MTLTRRGFTTSLLALGVTAASRRATAAGPARIAVIGGGAGGATAARTLKALLGDRAEVSLIEPSPHYTTCFFSNLYLGGLVSAKSLEHGYAGLGGVRLVQATATALDRAARTVTLSDGGTVAYDMLVLSPGIAFDYASIPGYSQQLADSSLPHAWKAGPQTWMLRDRLDALADGETIVMIAPPNPYRCPPGPYERVSMLAHRLKATGRGRAKIIILDPKEKFSKQALFLEGWQKHYPGMVEWIGGDVLGGLRSLDAGGMTVDTGIGKFTGGLINPIPKQRAGDIAAAAGLTDKSGFCPVLPQTMQSALDASIYVIGDAASAGEMPKSAFSATSQARTAAFAIRAALNNQPPPEPRYFNTCWSLIAPDDAVSIGAAYGPKDGKIASLAGFVSKPGETPDLRRKTAAEARDWYAAITAGMFG